MNKKVQYFYKTINFVKIVLKIDNSKKSECGLLYETRIKGQEEIPEIEVNAGIFWLNPVPQPKF